MSNRSTTRRRLLGVVASVAASAAALAMAPSALAQAPTGDYAVFKHCPRSAPNITACFYSETTSGSFTLGNATVPINKKIILQGGVAQDPNTFATTFVNAVGAPTLSRTPLNVPGGLTGLFDPQPGWNGLLTELVEAAIHAANGVTATAELVGPVGYSFTNYAIRTGAAITLPVRIKLDNPFLGDNCYVGSASNPVTLRLTTGTTAPPPPNTPISGSVGTLTYADEGNLVKADGYRLVDNAFSVPAASGCGPLLFRPLINAAVNLKEGFPSPAGRNTAILQGMFRQGDINAVNESAQ